jgi:hypothetical protein
MQLPNNKAKMEKKATKYKSNAKMTNQNGKATCVQTYPTSYKENTAMEQQPSK